MIAELRDWLAREQGVRLLETLGFENAYALAMRRERAIELGIRTIADLASRAAALTIGADLEFFARPEWTALRNAYGLEFAARREFTPTFMYRAVANGDAAVAVLCASLRPQRCRHASSPGQLTNDTGRVPTRLGGAREPDTSERDDELDAH